jgi:hypothetical protein
MTVPEALKVVTPRDDRVPGNQLPEIEDAASLLASPSDTPPEIIEGLLHQGAKMVIGGGSKSFKTWILTDLALSVARGVDWLGFPAQAGRVLYINLEIQRGFFRGRLDEISRAKGIALTAGLLDVWNLRGYAADLSLLIGEILARVGQRYVMIIIDPIYKCLGSRDENKAGDIGSLLNEIERLAVHTAAAVVFGAHYSKGNQATKDSIDRIGGSGVFARDPDSILVLTKHDQNDAFTVDTTLRNHAPVAPFVVCWQFPLMRRDNSLDPAKLKTTTGRPKVHNAEGLLDVLGEDSLTFSKWFEAAKEHAGMSKGTFQTLRHELLQSGRINQSKIDRTYEKVKKVNK